MLEHARDFDACNKLIEETQNPVARVGSAYVAACRTVLGDHSGLFHPSYLLSLRETGMTRHLQLCTASNFDIRFEFVRSLNVSIAE